MNISEIFSKRLNEMLNRRKPKKIKKNELAALLYVTPQTISRWCNGVIIPDRGTIELITQKINELYGYSSETPKRYRSEYLACEDNIPTYDFLPQHIMDYVAERNAEEYFWQQIFPSIKELMHNLGYDSNTIYNEKHFSAFIITYIKIAIESYIKDINPYHQQPLSNAESDRNKK